MFATPTLPFPLTPVLLFRHHCCPVHIHPYPHHRSRYGQYDIYFSNILKPSQLERIAEADEHEVVREVQVRILTHPNPGFLRRPPPEPLFDPDAEDTLVPNPGSLPFAIGPCCRGGVVTVVR